MKKFLSILCGVLMFPLSVLSETLAITSTGQGESEAAAISSARLQAMVDAEAAGFLRQDGYQISATRVIELTKEGSTYFARVDADLTKNLEPKRILFLISARDYQATFLNDLVRRIGASNSLGKYAIIEIVDNRVDGALKNIRPSDLQQDMANAGINQLLKDKDAELLYLLSASSDKDPIFLVSIFDGMEKPRKIRTLRGNDSLYGLIRDAVKQDLENLIASPDGSYVVTIPSSGVKVRRGQTVVVYADETDRNESPRSSILTYGVVVETYGSNVRILADRPLLSLPNTKLRLSVQKNRKTIINESEW